MPWTPRHPGNMCSDIAHFLCFPTSHRNVIAQPPPSIPEPGYSWILSLNFWLELDSYVNKLSRHIFSYYECFLNWGLPNWPRLLLCFLLSLVIRIRQHECFIYFIVNHHNNILFTVFIFPEAPLLSIPIRFCYKSSNLNLRQLVPS